MMKKPGVSCGRRFGPGTRKRRHALVLHESLKDEIRVIAEGQMALVDGLARFRVEMKDMKADLTSTIRLV